MLNNDYFSRAEITRRVNQRHRRNLRFRLHVFLSFLVTMAALLIPSVGVSAYLRYDYYDPAWMRDPIAFSALVTAVVWSLVYIHRLWKRSREHLAAEIDAEMREAREYELRRYELSRDPAYRLTDDGELFYDEEEIEYDVKPKRKHGG